jgi:hypothetical protein
MERCCNEICKSLFDSLQTMTLVYCGHRVRIDVLDASARSQTTTHT